MKKVYQYIIGIVSVIFGIIGLVFGIKSKYDEIQKDKTTKELMDCEKTVANNSGQIQSEKEKQQEIKDRYENEKNKYVTKDDLANFFNDIKPE